MVKRLLHLLSVCCVCCVFFFLPFASWAQSSEQTEKIEIPESLQTPNTPFTFFIEEDESSFPQGLRQKLTYSAKGTRSEARHSFLYIEDNLVPDTFTYVEYKKSAWSFENRNYMWGDDGYWPTEAHNVIESSQKFTEEMEKQGWYKGNQILRGTPDHWVYVEWRGGSAFIAPDKIESFLENYSLPILPREGQVEIRRS
jgi:hypothetical protein